MNPEEQIKELENKLAACEHHNTAKSEFLSIVVHQLRTPLAGNKWIFKMLLDGDLGAFTAEQKEIIQNIIENAIKYSRDDGKVIITLVPEPTQVKIMVEDSGIGITKTQQDKIFQKFFRADNAKEQKKTGTGLGLFTAKNIVERHHGT